MSKKKVLVFLLVILTAAGCNKNQAVVSLPLASATPVNVINKALPITSTAAHDSAMAASLVNGQTSSSKISEASNLSDGQEVLSEGQISAMAGNKFADGNVPLGDYKYVTNAPKKGYVYLCNAHKDNPGSQVNGPWINGSTWNFLQKVTVDGSVSWPNAQFSNTVSGAYRTLSGNDLPINHTTGVFPVAVGDDAHAYDPNPNTISAQSLNKKLPASPVYSVTPYCMGGEVGIALSGVALFNAFDAGLRDAPAHELQDSCDGHPQGSGEYHYHSLSACFKDTSVSTVLGFAYDGFPITGGQVGSKYLTTDDLDECHGITSEINLDGKKIVIYHYVMTKDFPYSASCFRAKPVITGPSAGQQVSQSANQQTQQASNTQLPLRDGPPLEAITACSGKKTGGACSFVSPRGDTISGSCQTPPNSSMACVPGR